MTDQLGSGIDIYLGQMNVDLCLDAVSLTYLAVRGGTPDHCFLDGWMLHVPNQNIFVTKVRGCYRYKVTTAIHTLDTEIEFRSISDL